MEIFSNFFFFFSPALGLVLPFAASTTRGSYTTHHARTRSTGYPQRDALRQPWVPFSVLHAGPTLFTGYPHRAQGPKLPWVHFLALPAGIPGRPGTPTVQRSRIACFPDATMRREFLGVSRRTVRLQIKH